MLETADAGSIVPALPDEPEPKPESEPENPILPQPDQDRTLAQTVAHYRSVLPPDGTVDGDEDPVDYAEQFRAFEAESGVLAVIDSIPVRMTPGQRSVLDR